MKRGLKEGDNVEWAIGYCDYYNGRNINDFPYDELDAIIEVSDWKKGWLFAQKEKGGDCGN